MCRELKISAEQPVHERTGLHGAKRRRDYLFSGSAAANPALVALPAVL
jgi:hypothetical protein